MTTATNSREHVGGQARPGGAASGRLAVWVVSRCVACLLLVLAAAGKAAALAGGVMPPLLGLPAREGMLALVGLECLLAAWLAAGWRPDLSRRVAAAAFCLFAAAAAVQALHGHQRCGCFGVVQVPLALMLPLDLAVAAGLAAGRAGLLVASAGRRPAVARAIACMATGLCALPALVAGTAWARQLAGGPGSVILTPEGISGHPADFLAHVPDGEPLAHNHWYLLVYRSDCRTCAQALPAFVHAAQQARRGTQYAVLLLPGSNSPSGRGDWLRVFHADPALTWYAVTPLVIELRDGMVERAERGVEGTAGAEASASAGHLVRVACSVWYRGFLAAGRASAGLRASARGRA